MIKPKKYATVYPYIILAVSACILLIRCYYSFCWSDETFYFSTTNRFYQGDSIFLHEWFPTQLSSVLLLPLFTLYMKIVGSTTGIILFFRIVYVIFSFICSIIIYRITKHRYPIFISFSCAFMYLFYVHLNIATMSYYTMSVSFFVLAAFLIYHFYQTKKKLYLVAGGVCFACSVLSLPTLAVAYFIVIFLIILLFLAVLFLPLKSTVKDFIKNSDLLTVCLYTFYGICIPAVIFMIYLFCHVSIPDFLSAIPYVLSDEEHVTSLTYPIRKFFIGINEVYDYAAYLGYMLIVITFVLAFLELLHKEIPRRLRTILTCVDLILFVIYAICSFGHTGYIQTALCMFALPLFALTKKKNWHLFFLLFVGGMIFALVFSYSSNGYLYILSLGHSIAALGSILFLHDFIEELLTKRTDALISQQLMAGLCAAILVYSLLITATLRITNVYRDAPLSELTAKIQMGPAAGLYTTEEHLRMYDNVIQTLNTYAQATEKNQTLFITKLLPYGYLCSDMQCGAPTTWRTKFNSARLSDYYTLNPDRIPDVILVLDQEYGSYDTCGDVEADPSPNENEFEGGILAKITAEDYQKTDVPCGIIYEKISE